MRRCRHRIPLVALASGALLVGGCDDERGAPTAPDTGALEGDVLFGAALVSSAFFALQNQLASIILAVHESPTLPLPFPVHEYLACTGEGQYMPRAVQNDYLSCAGEGPAWIFDNDDSDERTFRVRFGAGGVPFVVGFRPEGDMDPAVLALSGTMVYRFSDWSNQLAYTIEMEFDHATGTPRGVTMQLPEDSGGIILQLTTPYDGGVRYTLDTARANLDQRPGTILVQGTLRLEDRGAPLTIVEELAVTYRVRHTDVELRDLPIVLEDVLEFDPWPGGMYEIASNAPAAPGLPTTPGYPVEVFFNGLGQVSFSFEGHDCDADMRTGVNPCEDF